jgi:hypothetical protein
MGGFHDKRTDGPDDKRAFARGNALDKIGVTKRDGGVLPSAPKTSSNARFNPSKLTRSRGLLIPASQIKRKACNPEIG